MKRSKLCVLAAVGSGILFFATAALDVDHAAAASNKIELVRDVDNPARQAVQVKETFTFAVGAGTISEPLFTVPSGKRLVIEHASVNAQVPPGQKVLVLDVLTSVDGSVTFVQHFLVLTPQGSSAFSDFFAASQPMRVYAGPGTAVFLSAVRDTTTGSGTVFFTISGYLVECGAGPDCPLP